MLGKLQHENKHVYITSDFNVNMLPYIKSSLDRQDFKNIFWSSFFSSLITKPTRVTNHSATLIDNIYCNITEVSTHCKAGILKLSVITKISDKNVHNFHCNLKQKSWRSVYSASGTQPAFTRFQEVIDRHLNNNFKMQNFAMNYKNRHPWMTEELRTQIKR